jgi:hypothetical protein
MVHFNVILVLYVRLLPTEDSAGIRTIYYCQVVMPLMDQSALSLWKPIHVNALLHGARSPTSPTIVRLVLFQGHLDFYRQLFVRILSCTV